MNYIAFVQQKSKGCDYTIGCGVALWGLKAASYEDAMAELYNKILVPEEGEDYLPYGPGSEEVLKSATLYEVSNAWEIPLKLWFEKAVNDKRSKEEIRKESDEREQYERLKKKFGYEA
jgi:hypothetical protein